jgi:HK97 family phage prohead protease
MLQYRRQFANSQAHIRDAKTRSVGGLAVPFGVQELLAPDVAELWEPGSVKLNERGVRLLWAHDSGEVLASTTTGRLTLSIRANGVYWDAELPDTSRGKDVAELVRLGEVRGVSPGFFITREKWESKGSLDIRRIIEATIFEISLTSIPAYQSTSAELRGGDVSKSIKEFRERKLYLERQQRRSVLLRARTKGNKS